MTQITPFTSDPEQMIQVSMTQDEFLDFRFRTNEKKKPRTLKGLQGIMDLFQCSRAQAFKIAHEPWFAAARVQFGRHIVFDADKAWELAQANSYTAAEAEKKPAGRRA